MWEVINAFGRPTHGSSSEGGSDSKKNVVAGGSAPLVDRGARAERSSR